MNRQVGSINRLAAVALLVGLAATGCGWHTGAGADQPEGPTPATQPSQLDQSTPTLAPAESPSESPAPSDSPSAGSSADANTPDPIDSQLSALDNLLNGINSSLSGSDPDSSGGE